MKQTDSEFKTLLDACNLIEIDSGFTESYWPLEPVTADEVNWEVVEYHFSEEMLSGMILNGSMALRYLEEMEKQGDIRRLTGSRRAMEWIAANLGAPLDHPIVLPLCAGIRHRNWYLPVFLNFMGSGRRSLHLFCDLGKFYSAYGWLVLRKKQK